MFKIRTDLALETREEVAEKGIEDDGILFYEETIDGLVCSQIDITNGKAREATGRNIGTYVTVEFGKVWLKSHEDFVRAVETIAKKIKSLSEFEGGSVLIAGLGNIYITADSIGPKALSNILITRHIKNQMPDMYADFGMADISGIAPGVLGQTGMESADIIKAVAKRTKPSLVILIDALASRKISRLATTIQISNTGIAPGSGVGNYRHAIDQNFLGTKVMSIGVPTVVDAATLSYDVLEETCTQNNIEPVENLTHEILRNALEESGGNFFVTPKESDVIINEVSKIIGYAINRSFHNDISFEEMARMV